MKKYILTEKELRELLYSYFKLAALECGGVDNWEWYGGSISDYINQWVNDNNYDSDNDWNINDIVSQDIDEHYYITLED